MLRDLLRKEDYLVKIDLKDAYFIRTGLEKSSKIPSFVWKETMYEFACLLFRLSSAPRVFTKLMKPVVAQLQKQGIRLIIYLDDILIMAKTETLAKLYAQTTCNLLESLGFVINFQKSIFVPSKEMEFLGFLIDSRTMEKIRKVKKECQHLLDLQVVTVQELAKVLGHLTSTVVLSSYISYILTTDKIHQHVI